MASRLTALKRILALGGHLTYGADAQETYISGARVKTSKQDIKLQALSSRGSTPVVTVSCEDPGLYVYEITLPRTDGQALTRAAKAYLDDGDQFPDHYELDLHDDETIDIREASLRLIYKAAAFTEAAQTLLGRDDIANNLEWVDQGLLTQAEHLEDERCERQAAQAKKNRLPSTTKESDSSQHQV